MAQRRMFSKEVVASDPFLDMPQSSQNLYFHLGVHADDDGFVSPKSIIRLCGANSDDLQVLTAKGFIIPFQNSVIVITHWKMNNEIKNDRYKPTIYQEHMKALGLLENKAYSMDTKCIQHVSTLDTQYSIDKDSIGKARKGKVSRVKDTISDKSHDIGEVIKAFELVDLKNSGYYSNKSQRASAEFLISQYTLAEVIKVINVLAKTNKMQGEPHYFPSITSPYELKEKWSKFHDAIERVNKNKLKENDMFAWV